VIVVDASTVVAALADRNDVGGWAREVLDEHHDGLVAPHHCPFEAANVLRRLAITRWLDANEASEAHAALLGLTIELHAYEWLAPLAWRWRNNVTIYDGSYIALAVSLGSPLATADRRLAKSPPARRAIVLTPEAP
jgi:predicted nucleic acid-binding protein